MSTAATMTTPQAAEFSRFLPTQLGQKELPCMKILPNALRHTPCNKASQNHNPRCHTAYTCQIQPRHVEESSRPPQHTQEKSLARLLPQSDTKSFSMADDARKSPRDSPRGDPENIRRWFNHRRILQNMDRYACKPRAKRALHATTTSLSGSGRMGKSSVVEENKTNQNTITERILLPSCM